MGSKSKTKAKTTINMPSSTKKSKKSSKSTKSLPIALGVLTTVAVAISFYFNLSNPAIFRTKRETPEKNDHIQYIPGVKDGSGYHFNMPKNPSPFEKVSKTDNIAEQQKLLVERSSGVVDRDNNAVLVNDTHDFRINHPNFPRL